MSHELVYLLLICALLIVPRALQRYRVPAPLTCFAFGIGLMLAWPEASGHNDAIHLLAALGISTLFLYAGLEVDLTQLRRGVGQLLTYLALRCLTLALVAWLAWRFLGLQWQPAMLLALALLTSSTGFIVDSLDRFEMREEDRFWVTNKAIAGELLALALMFFVLKASNPIELGASSMTLLALVALTPVIYVALGRWIVPHAPGSEFSLLVMVGFVAAYVTDKIGVEYLLGAFIAGLLARLLRPRVPALASDDIMHAVKLFSSFFVPFYFFANGARVPTGALTWEALLVGLGLTAMVLPGRFGVIWIQRRWLFRDSAGSSLRVSMALMPTLIFTLVLATILHDRFAIPDALFGGLLLYAFLNTLLPSLVLRTPFDVAPLPTPVATVAPAGPAGPPAPGGEAVQAASRPSDA
ncbi:cation:proton antiporter [Lysobacter sp. TAF61]|uniref:cation:proton antiporter n=1 Tax=Lysobacter sp. TAF61 TaxID=3233072 RepID=UPI003F98C8A7